MRYAKYKPTGIAWLPEVPEGWEVRRVRNHYTVVSGSGFSPEIQGQSVGDYPVCKASDISAAGKEMRNAANWISADVAKTSGFHIMPSGSLLFPKIGEAMRKNSRTLAKIDCCADNNCQGLVPRGIDIDYTYYLFTQIDMNWFDNAGPVPCLSNKKLLGFPIPYPPLPTQRAIVAYLDEKCGKVDRLVAAKEKEAALLKELKQSMIAEAVTRGVRSKRRLVPSGIPWLPEVPERWQLVRNKAFFKLTDEKVGFRKNDFTLLSLTKQGVIVRDLTAMKGKFPKDFDTYLVVRPNNLVFCLFDVDETPRTVGLVKNVGMLTGAYTNFEVDQSVLLPEFAYYYYLHVDDAKKLRPYYTGLRKVVKTNTFMQLRMPVPPLVEQQEIVAHIEVRAAKIDAAVKGLERLVAALKEYKQRLIADVVTGQRKVA